MRSTGNLTIGQFTLFITLLLQLVWPLEALGWIINLGQRATAAASRSFAWLDSIEPLPEPAQPEHLPDGPADDPARGRPLQLRRRQRGAVGRRPRGRSGRDRRGLRRHGRRQDVAPQPAAALLRPHRGAGADRRRRQPRPRARRAARVRRARDAEARAVLDAAARQPARRAARRRLGRGARGLRDGRRGRLRRRAAERLRHADRRARRQPLRRAAPARRARARPDRASRA